jgi:hypothetical protein
MKSESVPSIIHSFIVGKKCFFCDDHSTDDEAATHSLMKTKVSNFAVFCPTVVSYSFMRDGTVTTGKYFRTHFCSANLVESRVCTPRER